MASSTIQARFEAAKKEIRRNKVRALVNVMGCCRSCIDIEGPADQKIIWQYGGQGHAFTFEGGLPCERSRDWRFHAVDSIYFNHDNLSMDEVNDIIAIFAKHDIVATCESLYQCIEIDFAATKDNDDVIHAAEAILNDTKAFC